ncbi:fluoride efflux transporter CrcB [Bradyrhizobium ganzhouense]|uniref:fluoride efflux transporter CrcB n=1 Tax=Bradyrhizobium ganzhouense TaxID=1179767 RepID=UPI003CEC4573
MKLPSFTDRWPGAKLYAWVSFGSILGGLARYFVSLVLDTGPGFPFATLFINATGSMIIGFYATLTGPDGRVLARPEHRQFVMTGFCGGYTTFSAFSLETFRLFHGGMKLTALSYVAASVVCWLVSVWFGHMMASRYNRLKRS